MKHAVSVVIYTHNEADYIEHAAETLLTGEHTNLDLIIVDDGSTDRTAAVVGMLSLNERYRGLVRVISHLEEEGKLSSWADGVKAARADYVFCMSSKDVLAAEQLEQLYNVIHEAQADIAIPTLAFSENPHDTHLEVGKIITPPKAELVAEDIVTHLFIGDTYEPHVAGWLFKKDLLLHSFAKVDKEDLAQIDESGIVFIAALRAEKAVSAPEIKPLVTTTIFSVHARKTEVFEDLCSQNKTLTMCKNYLESTHATPSQTDALEGLSLMLCTRVCRLFPTRVPAEYWERGAKLLLNCWGAETVASSYAHLPQISLSEVAIALSCGLPKSEGTKIERVCLLIQDQEQLLDALAYADKLVKAKKSVSYIIEENLTVSPGMPVAAKLPAQIFSKSRATALKEAYARTRSEALIVFGHERRFAYDMLLARAQNLQVGLITEEGHFTPKRFLELLPQVAFSNAVVAKDDVYASLWNELGAETSTLTNLTNKLGQKTRGGLRLASKKLVFTFSRLAFGYLHKSALLKNTKDHATQQLQKDIDTLLAQNKELEQKLFETTRERDEYKGYFEGRLSKRIVNKHLQDEQF